MRVSASIIQGRMASFRNLGDSRALSTNASRSLACPTTTATALASRVADAVVGGTPITVQPNKGGGVDIFASNICYICKLSFGTAVHHRKIPSQIPYYCVVAGLTLEPTGCDTCHHSMCKTCHRARRGCNVKKGCYVYEE